MKKRVADIIVETLVERGVTDCFGVVGGGAMHLDNALGMNPDMRKTFNHHEQASAMAADAYGRLHGKPALVCVTTGPGATNTITGVLGAWQDSVPMIVISGQVRYAISIPQCGLPLRYRGIQEYQIVPSIKNMTKYAVMITDPLSVRAEVNKAIDISMSGRRGPVWLDIPLDIQSAVVEEDDLYENEVIPQAPAATTADVEEVLAKLASAKRPVILAGQGIRNSGNIEAFRDFAEKTGLPIIGASLAGDIMYLENERYYGPSGFIGPRTGNFIVQNADVILALGTNLSFKVTGFAQEYFAPNAYMIAVDVDEYEMQKPGIRVHHHVHSDLKAFFEAAAPVVKPIDVPKDWLDYCDALKARFSPYEASEGLSMDERVCSYWFWKKYDELAPQDQIMAMGCSTANSARLQIGTIYKDQRIINNVNCGAMGKDLPMAIGSAVDGTSVILATGDGNIMMNLQELQTIKTNKLPVKIIVFSNDGYNAIRQSSLNFFNGFNVGCNAESGLTFPSFEKVATAFEYDYKCCHNNGEVEDCLKWLFAAEGNVFLEIEQRLDDPVTPKVMSRRLADGTMASPALQDMYPFISEEEMERWMAISKE